MTALVLMLSDDDDDDSVGVGVFGIGGSVELPTGGVYSLTVAVGPIGGGTVSSIWMLLLLLSFLLSSLFRDRCHWVSFASLLCYWRTTVCLVGLWLRRLCGVGVSLGACWSSRSDNPRGPLTRC